MSNGFGFSFPNNDDDDNDGRRDQNPFGAFGGANGGGLGDMLNQFGQMLSGMGSSMNSPENSGPVNYDMAKRIALQQIKRTIQHNNLVAPRVLCLPLLLVWL